MPLALGEVRAVEPSRITGVVEATVVDVKVEEASRPNLLPIEARTLKIDVPLDEAVLKISFVPAVP